MMCGGSPFLPPPPPAPPLPVLGSTLICRDEPWSKLLLHGRGSPKGMVTKDPYYEADDRPC